MEETTLKQYIGTKTVKAEPMVKSAAVAKDGQEHPKATQILQAITSSTPTQMAAHTIPGPLRMCSRSHTRLPKTSRTAWKSSSKS